MKEGVLVESGTHKSLMKVNGEYARLYEVQAKAFTVRLRLISISLLYAPCIEHLLQLYKYPCIRMFEFMRFVLAGPIIAVTLSH